VAAEAFLMSHVTIQGSAAKRFIYLRRVRQSYAQAWKKQMEAGMRPMLFR
jgi:hypothetical protein